ncbi:outer membrane beta-barrel protein [Pasteurella oralis]|uniref:outer membrane beta-barrel protein n=1 Tax=Pasteurella oralis TaxID=1071947 RepID=UPI000C7E1FAE|nr:outer membrane beta-barrel protein [Pasteurella oralis]
MKINTLLLTTLSVLPAFAIAQAGQFNFYGKAGIDLTSRFESVEMSTTIRNHFLNSTAITSKKNTFSPSIFLETTYNILPQTEIGLGMGYIKRKGFNHVASATYRGSSKTETITEKFKINRYSSIPVYLAIKQNYPLNQNTTLYFNGNLGYSFNKIRNTTYDIKDSNPTLDYSRAFNLKTKNGLYWGLGMGMEYKSFLVEIGYYHTNSSINIVGIYNGKEYESGYHSYNNDALRFSIGFKF